MPIDTTVLDKAEMLDRLAMEYETSVYVFSADNYLNEFYDFFEIKNRKQKLISSPNTFHEALKELSGDDVWQRIAEKTEALFGVPTNVSIFEDDTVLKDEMEGPDGLAPFFFVFDMMFCEYDDFSLLFISGTNN